MSYNDNLELEDGNKVSSSKDITKIINSFLNEMEIALIKDVEILHSDNKISQEVYNAFIARDMKKLDELFFADQESFRSLELSSIAAFNRGDSSAKIPKWSGKNFKVQLKNRDFPNAGKVAKSIPPVLLLGSPGIGKSDVVRSIAFQRGYGPAGIVDVRLSQKESVDMRGFPVPNRNTKSVEWFVSAEWPRNPLSRGILFLDEITSAPKSVQVGAYELILDRKLGDVDSGGYDLPPGWLICAAGNLATDDAVVEDISSALANRMLHLVMKVNVDSWLAWAKTAGVHPCVQSFISDPVVMAGLSSTRKLHNMNINRGKTENGVTVPVVNRQQGWPSPRSWARVATILDSYEQMKKYEIKLGTMSLDPANRYSNFQHIVSSTYSNETTTDGFIKPSYIRGNLMDKNTLKDMIIGLIGFETGSEFFSYYINYTDSINTLKNLLSQDNLQESTQIAVFKDSELNMIPFSSLVENMIISLSTGSTADAKKASREIIGGHPLVYLYAAPNVLISRSFYDDHIKDAGDAERQQAAYEKAIKNLLLFVNKLIEAARRDNEVNVNAIGANRDLIIEQLKRFAGSPRGLTGQINQAMSTYFARAYDKLSKEVKQLKDFKSEAEMKIDIEHATVSAQRMQNQKSNIVAPANASKVNKAANTTTKTNNRFTPANSSNTSKSNTAKKGANFKSSGSGLTSTNDDDGDDFDI
jgi:hypothetical protein